ncbi:MAG: aminotransferase class I/II-fold pyridoxal phosphate-dependent enzyme [Pirellula sp.]
MFEINVVLTEHNKKSSSIVFDHARAPLYDCIRVFRERLIAPFYCPGHKGGRSLPPELQGSLGELDLNNLPDTDTLHCPTGPIRDAEELVADAYGVDRSFLMVGGSSLGNMAAVMSIAGPNDTVLVQRNAHKSVIAGIIHSGASPVWLMPEWDQRFGIAHGLDISTVEQAVARHADAKGLVVLNPTYFGTVADIKAISHVCDRRSIALIADEAHGPHFRFGEGYPLAAENAGADIVVQSTHKILSGLSQAAVLHLNGNRVDPARVQAALQSLQTTSPNFAIIASIDLARRQMMQEGRSRLNSMLELSDIARHRIRSIKGIELLEQFHALGSGRGFYALDRTKLLIDTSRIGWSGEDALRFLNREYGVQPELSGAGYLLCILTLGSIREDVDQLVCGLKDLSVRKPPHREDLSDVNLLAARVARELPEAMMTPREAFYSKQQSIPIEKAMNRISAEIVTPYPPGIPVMMPGERFNRYTLELLGAVKRSGCPISAVDPSLETVRVVSGVSAKRATVTAT